MLKVLNVKASAEHNLQSLVRQRIEKYEQYLYRPAKKQQDQKTLGIAKSPASERECETRERP
jgi:hypothetical protein